MAKNRIINTRFWTDSYIEKLSVPEKLLFIYLLSNPLTDICGMYEISIETIAYQTKIPKRQVAQILQKFEQDGKVVYVEGWVAIRNFVKYQVDNPKVLKGIENGKLRVPTTLLDRLSEKNIAYDSLSHLNSNSNSNSNKNTYEQSSLAPVKEKYGEFLNVLLTEEEHKKLIEKMGEKNTGILIEELSQYLASKKKNYLSHYAVIQTWARRKYSELKAKTLPTKTRTLA